jgi:hypothetical protein
VGPVNATTFTGDGSQLTGIEGFPFTGSARITGSLVVVGPVNATSFTGSLQGIATSASYIQLTNVNGFTAYSASINTAITPQTATVNTGSSPLTLTTQSIVVADSTNGNLIINLPDLNTIVGTPNQKPIVVYKNDYSQNVIYVNPSGSQLVNGASQDIIVSIQLAVIYNPTSAGWVTEGTSAQSLAELELFFLSLTETGSLATTGSNTFRGNQTITGSLKVSGSTTINGSLFLEQGLLLATGSTSLIALSQDYSYFGIGTVNNFPSGSALDDGAIFIATRQNQPISTGPGVQMQIKSGSEVSAWYYDTDGTSYIPGNVNIGFDAPLSAYSRSGSLNIKNGNANISGSVSITGSLTVTGGITGSATSASYVEYANVANKPTLVSSSAQIVGYNVFATTGSNQFNGSQAITGSLTVTGQVIAQTLNVQQVTSSIVYSSGSNIFGNSLGNTQQFTGSVSVTGSLTTSIATLGTAATTFLTSDSGTIKSRTAAQTLSDIAALPLAGGTLTGALSLGTNTLSSGRITLSTNDQSTNRLTITNTGAGGRSYSIVGGLNGANNSGFSIYDETAGSTRFDISSTGAATFSGALNGTSGAFSGGLTVTSASTTGMVVNSTNGASFRGFTIQANGTTQGGIELLPNTGEIRIGGYSTTGDYFPVIYSDGVAALTFGIGAAPTATFSSKVSISASDDILRFGNLLRWGFQRPTGDNRYVSFVRNANATAVPVWTVDGDNGNVGIGTTTVNSKFIVVDNNEPNITGNITSGTQFAASIANGWASLNVGAYDNGSSIRYGYLRTAFSDGAQSGADMRFYTGPTERMRITSGGALLIGTTSGSGIGTGSSVNQGVEIGSGLISIQTNNNSNNYWSKATGYTSGDFTAHFVNSAYVGGISTNGSATNYATASDYRLKQDLKDFEGINLINKIKTYDYEWKVDNTRMFGIIAHELQEILPYAVTGEKDAERMQAVDYSKLVPILIKAIQEQQSQIESLKAEIQTLKQ